MLASTDSMDNNPATSLQPLIKTRRQSNNKPNKKTSPRFASPKLNKKQVWPNINNQNKKKYNKIIFGLTIIILTIVVTVLIVLFVLVLDIFDSTSPPKEKPKLLFISHPNSKIYTMDSSIFSDNHTVESFCVDINSSKFLFVGNKTETYNLCINKLLSLNNSLDDGSFKEIELNEKYSILPGLIDSHAHIMSYGAKFFQVDLSSATSIHHLRTLIQEYIFENNLNVTDWIRGYAWAQNSWNNWNYDELPTQWNLDNGNNSNIIKNYKLFLTRIDGTSALCNNEAIIAVYGNSNGLTNADDPEGGEIVRLSNGTATGMLIGTPAMWLISNYIPAASINTQNEMFQNVLNECSANGLTGIHDAGNGPDYIDLYKNAIDNNTFDIKLRINAFASAYNHPSDYDLMFLYKDLLTVQSVKHYMDGSLGPWGASMIEAYCDNPNTTGVLRWNSYNEYYDNISIWHEYGFQITTHAIGDNANRLVINAYEELINEYNLTMNHRLRIEHCQIVNASVDIPRIGLLHIIPSMQPAHCTSDMIFAPSRLNCTQYGNGDRLSGAYAWNLLLESKIDALPFGSDFPAVGVVNPFTGIYAAVTRSNETGYPKGGYPEEYNKVSLYQAIKGYTIDAAYSAFQEEYLGSITKDKYADFIIIDRDLFNLDDYKDILNTNVLKTYLGGDIVFDSSW